MVGSTSTVRTLASLTSPSVWPGSLMKRGTHGTSAASSGVSSWPSIPRMGPPGSKEIPWSAVSTMSGVVVDPLVP